MVNIRSAVYLNYTKAEVEKSKQNSVSSHTIEIIE